MAHFRCWAIFLIGLPAVAQDALPPAAPPYYRVRYEPSTEAGELVYGVSYTIWIPPGVKALRGIVVHQHGCGEGACKAGRTAAYDLHWQALAKKHDCALLGPSYEQPEGANCALWFDPRNGSDKTFLRALDDLAARTRHAELSKIPWALWGHSGGAGWVGAMLLLHPERVAAVWLRSGTPRREELSDANTAAVEIPAAIYAVPIMCNLGMKEGVTEKEGRFARVWPNTLAFFTEMRAKRGLIGIAIDPLSSHDCGNQRYLAIPWFDACLAARLPEKAGDGLRTTRETDAWLAVLKDGAVSEAPRPAAQFSGDLAQAVWLPNERVAKAWSEYVKDSAVADVTPPAAPTAVQLRAGGELTWDAEGDLESGLAAFIVQRDGLEVARVPEKPSGTIGRQIFQKNSYSDTPSPPLAVMRYVDTTAKPGEKHDYRIISVNSVGLASAPSSLAQSVK